MISHATLWSGEVKVKKQIGEDRSFDKMLAGNLVVGGGGGRIKFCRVIKRAIEQVTVGDFRVPDRSFPISLTPRAIFQPELVWGN